MKAHFEPIYLLRQTSYRDNCWVFGDRSFLDHGRARAAVAPHSVMLKRNGKITVEALRFGADII